MILFTIPIMSRWLGLVVCHLITKLILNHLNFEKRDWSNLLRMLSFKNVDIQIYPIFFEFLST